ncbi:MAG: hypothetical protein U5L11_05840 [Arhodomonas sp.]|nr:hypothetical protein [Arhodomonas sp.]
MSLHFARELGWNRVFRLPPSEHDNRLPGPLRRRQRHDNTLFGEDVTYQRLADLLGDRRRHPRHRAHRRIRLGRLSTPVRLACLAAVRDRRLRPAARVHR